MNQLVGNSAVGCVGTHALKQMSMVTDPKDSSAMCLETPKWRTPMPAIGTPKDKTWVLCGLGATWPAAVSRLAFCGVIRPVASREHPDLSISNQDSRTKLLT